MPHCQASYTGPCQAFFFIFAGFCNIQCHNGYILLPHKVSSHYNKINLFEVNLYTVYIVVNAMHAFNTTLFDAKLLQTSLATKCRAGTVNGAARCCSDGDPLYFLVSLSKSQWLWRPFCHMLPFDYVSGGITWQIKQLLTDVSNISSVSCIYC